MPTTYTSRTVPTTTWGTRPVPGGVPTYESPITYEAAGYQYDGSGGLLVTSWNTRSVPSTTWNTRSPI